MSSTGSSNRIPNKEWLLEALEGVSGKCLDTEEEREEVADHIIQKWREAATSVKKRAHAG